MSLDEARESTIMGAQVDQSGEVRMVNQERWAEIRGLFYEARGTGADLLWRIKQNLWLPADQRLPDGSYLSRIYATPTDQRQCRDGVTARVIEYRLEGVPGAEPLHRLLTTILDPGAAPAAAVAALDHKRWEIETVFDELKTHLRGARIVLRSKTPDLVMQEFYGATASALRRPRPHARSGLEGEGRFRSTLVSLRGPCGAAETRTGRGSSPLRTGSPFMRRCSVRSWMSVLSRVDPGASHRV